MLIVGKRDISEPGGPERGNISIKATARVYRVYRVYSWCPWSNDAS